jgi:hypothetical protein
MIGGIERMTWQEMLGQTAATEHWLYFAIGFGSSSVLWLVFIAGLFLGNYRKRMREATK